LPLAIGRKADLANEVWRLENDEKEEII